MVIHNSDTDSDCERGIQGCPDRRWLLNIIVRKEKSAKKSAKNKEMCVCITLINSLMMSLRSLFLCMSAREGEGMHSDEWQKPYCFSIPPDGLSLSLKCGKRRVGLSVMHCFRYKMKRTILDNYPTDNYPGDNYQGLGQLPHGQLPQGQLPTRATTSPITTHQDHYPL